VEPGGDAKRMGGRKLKRRIGEKRRRILNKQKSQAPLILTKLFLGYFRPTRQISE
jgi:hypothetical protein